MFKRLLLLHIVVVMAQIVSAQYTFINKGRIVFERKVNTHAILPQMLIESKVVTNENLAAYLQDYKSRYPQFYTDSFQLLFNTDTSFYEPLTYGSNFLNGVIAPMANENKVYINLLQRKFLAEKNAYNEVKYISDTLPTIRWKLTDETREIAGYECRRANAIIGDSIYIVAFYTDVIKFKGGPELFHGLPGMILGVAAPYLHISYFAIRVELPLSSDKFDLPKLTRRENHISQTEFFVDIDKYYINNGVANSWVKGYIRL